MSPAHILPDTTFSLHKSFSAQIFLCTNLSLYKSFSVQIFLCTNLSLHKSFSAQIFLCTNLSLHKSFFAQIFLCTNLSLYKSFSAQLFLYNPTASSWQTVTMINYNWRKNSNHVYLAFKTLIKHKTQMIQMQIRKHKNVRRWLTIYRITCNTYSQNTSSHKLPPTNIFSALSAQVHLDNIPIKAFADNEMIELKSPKESWRVGQTVTIPTSTKMFTLVACNVRNKISQICFYFIFTLRNNDACLYKVVLWL